MGWLSRPSEAKDVDALYRLFGGSTPDPEWPASTFSNHVEQGWNKNELVYSCIEEKATSFPEGTLRVYDALGRRGEPLQGHPLRRLLSSPNPLVTEFDMFELLVLHLDLAGNAFWEKVYDRAGRLVELWPVRPDRIRMKRNGRQVAYGYAVQDTSKTVPIDVVHFKLPNPVDWMVGSPPMRAALRATALDNEATDFVKALLQNHAIPGVVVKLAQLDSVLDEATTERLKAKWKQSYSGKRRGEPAFLQTGMDVQELGLNLKDLEFPDLRTISESRICMAFGVPPIIVGAKVGLDRSTFSNYAEARKSFWEQTLMPLQRRIRDTITAQLLPDLLDGGPGSRGLRNVSVRWDNSEVLALRESEESRWSRATEAFRAGGLTVNDYRRELGLPEVDSGDVFLMPSGVIATRDMAGAVESLNGQPSAEPVAASAAPELEVKADPRDDLRTAAERRHSDALGAFYDRAEADVRRALNTKAGLPIDAWRDDLADRLYDAGFSSSRDAALAVLADFDAERIEAWHHARAQAVARDIADALHTDSLAALVEPDPAEAVDHLFEVRNDRRDVAATGMATAVLAWGAREAGRQATEQGSTATKTWITGPNPRRSHAEMNGETVGIDEPFSNGMQYPADISADVDEVAGCNCTVAITVE